MVTGVPAAMQDESVDVEGQCNDALQLLLKHGIYQELQSKRSEYLSSQGGRKFDNEHCDVMRIAVTKQAA